MAQGHAIMWDSGDSAGPGRLDTHADRFELHGRARDVSILFAEITAASIGRGRDERLLGMPVLVLRRNEKPAIRIASLEAPGLLHELAARVERGRLDG
jgi:hypothetical protein